MQPFWELHFKNWVNLSDFRFPAIVYTSNVKVLRRPVAFVEYRMEFYEGAFGCVSVKCTVHLTPSFVSCALSLHSRIISWV